MSITREAYGYVYGNPLNMTDPSGLFGIPGTDWCVDIADDNCHSRADSDQERHQAAGFVPMEDRDENDRYYDDDYEQLSKNEKAAVDAKCLGQTYDEKTYNSGKNKIKKNQKRRGERRSSGGETNKSVETQLGDNLWPDNLTWSSPAWWVYYAAAAAAAVAIAAGGVLAGG